MDELIKALRTADVEHTTDELNVTHVTLGEGRRVAVGEATTETGEEATGYDATWYDTEDGEEREVGTEWFDTAGKAVGEIRSRMS